MEVPKSVEKPKAASETSPAADSDEDTDVILEESPCGRWQKRREKVRQRDVPGVDIAYLAMDSELGVEVVWNEVHFADRKRFLAEEEGVRSVFDKLIKLDHPNLIKVHSYWMDRESEKPRVIFITEYMSSGTISQFLKRTSQSSKALSIKSWKKWCIPVLWALDYLHSFDPPIVHCNLTCNTLFIQQNGLIKMVCVTPDAMQLYIRQSRENPRNLHYIAPEYQQGKPVAPPIDIYAFGVCALEMATLGFRSLGADIPVVTKDIIDKVTQTLEHPLQMDLICRCVQSDPAARPTAHELLFHRALFEVPSLKLLCCHTLVRDSSCADSDVRISSSKGDKERILAEVVHSNGAPVPCKQGDVAVVDLDKMIEDVRNGIYPLTIFRRRLSRQISVVRGPGTASPVDATEVTDQTNGGSSTGDLESSENQYPPETRRVVEMSADVKPSDSKSAKMLTLMFRFQDNLHRELVGEFADSETAHGLVEELVRLGFVSDNDREMVADTIADSMAHYGLADTIAEKEKLKKRQSIVKSLLSYAGREQLPLVFVKGDCVGCACDLEELNKRGLLKECLEDHKYDLVVLGGGSGGLAAAKEAAFFGKRVAVLDYVVPSPVGTSWGLGGTCVNVGCIPKKLMHRTAILGHCVEDAKQFGWQVEEKPRHDWKAMTDAIQGHISSLNWGHRVALREKSVVYLNAFGSFVGSHSLKAVDKRGKEQLVTSDRFLIATGLRPRYLNIPGAKEYCITSDDLFSLSYCPGKTLCVGASYVSLECAGFLRGIGLDVTVMIERLEEGKPGLLRVIAEKSGGEIIEDTYNTVLLAIGRDALTDSLNLDMLGVKRNEKNKKVICRPNEQSVSVPYIYAIGDVLDGGLELTPVAIKAGKMLARRLFGASPYLCDYQNVPTTVFTPLEYGSCGLAEEKAIEKYGKENIEVFHAFFTPLEFTVPKRVDSDHCYAKLVCNKADGMRVLGFHVLSPDAGEITQGFGIALRMKATKHDFDLLVGIHPTCAEIFTSLVVTKSSQQELKKGSC
ncbi:thioredoxin and glutathione reductase [Trichuris suis]|nr:thioredoxin and glutathione reductase [Trichuris suis]